MQLHLQATPTAEYLYMQWTREYFSIVARLSPLQWNSALTFAIIWTRTIFRSRIGLIGFWSKLVYSLLNEEVENKILGIPSHRHSIKGGVPSQKQLIRRSSSVSF